MRHENYDFIVVGGGPAGAFFAYEMLKKNPEKRILLIEQGKRVEERKCPESTLKECVKCKPFCNITCGFQEQEHFLMESFHCITNMMMTFMLVEISTNMLVWKKPKA